MLLGQGQPAVAVGVGARRSPRSAARRRRPRPGPACRCPAVPPAGRRAPAPGPRPAAGRRPGPGRRPSPTGRSRSARCDRRRWRLTPRVVAARQPRRARPRPRRRPAPEPSTTTQRSGSAAASARKPVGTRPWNSVALALHAVQAGDPSRSDATARAPRRAGPPGRARPRRSPTPTGDAPRRRAARGRSPGRRWSDPAKRSVTTWRPAASAGRDHLGHVLGPIRRHQQRLGPGVEPDRCRGRAGCARSRAPDHRAARLAGRHRVRGAAASRRAWVDLPQPSPPSKAMNAGRRPGSATGHAPASASWGRSRRRGAATDACRPVRLRPLPRPHRVQRQDARRR